MGPLWRWFTAVRCIEWPWHSAPPLILCLSQRGNNWACCAFYLLHSWETHSKRQGHWEENERAGVRERKGDKMGLLLCCASFGNTLNKSMESYLRLPFITGYYERGFQVNVFDPNEGKVEGAEGNGEAKVKVWEGISHSDEIASRAITPWGMCYRATSAGEYSIFVSRFFPAFISDRTFAHIDLHLSCSNIQTA